MELILPMVQMLFSLFLVSKASFKALFLRQVFQTCLLQ